MLCVGGPDQRIQSMDPTSKESLGNSIFVEDVLPTTPREIWALVARYVAPQPLPSTAGDVTLAGGHRREAGPSQQRGPTAHRPDDAGGGGSVARGGSETPVAWLRGLVCPILAQQAGPPHGPRRRRWGKGVGGACAAKGEGHRGRRCIVRACWGGGVLRCRCGLPISVAVCHPFYTPSGLNVGPGMVSFY
jgi:hypothetical protein